MSGPKARKASKAKVSLSESKTLLNGSLSTSLSSSKYDLEAMFPMTPTLKELRMKAYLDKSRNSSCSSHSKNDSLALSSSGQSSAGKNIFKKPSAKPTSDLDVSLKMLETTMDTSVGSVKQVLGNLKSNPKKSVNMSNLSLENSLNESVPLQNGNKKINGKVPVFDLNNISSLDHSLNETAENIILRKNPMYKRKSLHLNFSSLENTVVESDHEQEGQDTKGGKSDSVVNHSKEELIIPFELVGESREKMYNILKSSEINVSAIAENCEIVCDKNKKTESAALEMYDEKSLNDKNISVGPVVNNISNVVRNDNREAKSDSNKFFVDSENITEESSIDTCIQETQEETEFENNSDKPFSHGIQNKLNASENVKKVSENDPEVNTSLTYEEHCETLDKSKGCTKLPEDSKCSIKNIEMSFDSSQLKDNSVNGLRRSTRKKRKSVWMSNVLSLESNFNMLKDSSVKNMEKSLDSSDLKGQLMKNIKQRKKSLRLSHFSCETDASVMDPDLIQDKTNNVKEDQIEGCSDHIGSENDVEELLESCKDVTEGAAAFTTSVNTECPAMHNIENKSDHINVSECMEEVVESQPENCSEVPSSQTDSINDVIIKKPSAPFKLSEINNSTLENIGKSLDSSQIENQLVNGLRKSIRQKIENIKLSNFTCLMDTVHETEADSITVQDIDTKPSELQNLSKEPKVSLLRECAIRNSDDVVDVDQANTISFPVADNKETAINLSGQLEETQPELSEEVTHSQKDVKNQGISKKPAALSNLTKINNLSYQHLEKSLDSSQVVNQVVNDVRKSVKQKKRSVRVSDFTLFENTLPENDNGKALSQDIGKQPAQLQNVTKKIETVTVDNREDEENGVPFEKSILPDAECKEGQIEESSATQPENFQIISSQDERFKEAISKKPKSSKITNIDQLSCENIENSLDSSQVVNQVVNDVRKSVKQKKISVRVSDFTFLTNTIPETDDRMVISQNMERTDVRNTTKDLEELSDQNRKDNQNVVTNNKSVLPDAGNETIETQPDNAQLIISSQNDLINDPVLKKTCAHAKKSCLQNIENSLVAPQGENDLENGLRKCIKQKSVRVSDFTFLVPNENTLAETETDNLISQNVNTHSDLQNFSKECIEPINECRKDVENVIHTEKSILPGIQDNQTTLNMSVDIEKSVNTQPEAIQEVISSQNNSSFQDIENSLELHQKNQLVNSTRQQKKSVRINDDTFIVTNKKLMSNIEVTQDKDNQNDEYNSLVVQNIRQHDLENKCDEKFVKSSVAKNPSLSSIPRWVGAKIKTLNEASHDKIVSLDVTRGNEKLSKSTIQKRESVRCCDETFIISKKECVSGLEEDAKMESFKKNESESLLPTQDEQKTNTRNDTQELVLESCISKSEKNTSISVKSENSLHNNAHEPDSVSSEFVQETFPENYNKIISSQNNVLNQLSVTSNMSEMEDSYLETMEKSVDTSQLQDRLINKLRKTIKQKKKSLKMSDSSLSVSCEEILSEPLKKIIYVENKKSGSSEDIPKIAMAPDADTCNNINQKSHGNSLGTSALNVKGTESAFLNSSDQVNKPIGNQLQNSSLISSQDYMVCVDALNQPNTALHQTNVKDKTINIGAEETLPGVILATVSGVNDNLSNVTKMYEKSLLGNEIEGSEDKSVAIETKSLVPITNNPTENELEHSKLCVESETVNVLDTGNEVMSMAETSKSKTSKRDPNEFVDNGPSCLNITQSKFALPNLSTPINEVVIDEMNYKNDNLEDPETNTDEKCVLVNKVKRSKDNIFKDNSNKETLEVSLPRTVEAQYTGPKSPKPFNKPIENQREHNTNNRLPSDHQHSNKKSTVEREDKVPDDDNVCNDVADNITLNKFIEFSITSTPYTPEHSDKLIKSLSENHMSNSLASGKTKIHEEHAMQEVKHPEDNACNAQANNSTKSYLLRVPCVSQHSDKPIESQSENYMDTSIASVKAKIDEEYATGKEVRQPNDATCNSEADIITCCKFTESSLPGNIDKPIDSKSENSVNNSLAGVISKIEEDHVLGNDVSIAETCKSQSIKEDFKMFGANKSSFSSNKEPKSDLPISSEPTGKATISETGNTININNVLSEDVKKNEPSESSELIGKKDYPNSKVEKTKTFQMPDQMIDSSERSKETKINITHKSNYKGISAEPSREIHFDGDILQPSNFENENVSVHKKNKLSLSLSPSPESLDYNFVNEISKVEPGNPPSSPTGNFIPKNYEVHTSKPSQASLISMQKIVSNANENQENPASSSLSIEPFSNKETSKKGASMSNEPLPSTENKKQSGQIDKDLITSQNDKIVHNPNGDNCAILEDVAPTNNIFKMPRTSQLGSVHSPRSFLGKSAVDVTNCSIKDQNLDWSIDVSVIQPDMKNRRDKLRSQSTPLPTKRVSTKIDENNPVTPKPAIVKPNLTKQGDKKKPKKSVTFNISTPVSKSGEECHPPLDNLSDVSLIPGDDLKTNNGALSVTRSPHSLSKGENKQQSKVSSQSSSSFSESKRAPKKSKSVQVTREYISSSSGEWSQSKVAELSKSSKKNKSEASSTTDYENINKEKVLHISTRRSSRNFSGKSIESKVSMDFNSDNAVESFVQNETNLNDSVALFNPPKKQRLDKSVRDRSTRVTPEKQNLSQSKETYSSVNNDTSEVPSQRRVRALTSITNTESFRSPRLSSGNSFNDDSVIFPPKKKTKLVDSSFQNSNKNISRKSSSSITNRSNYGSSQLDDSIPLGYSVSDSEELPDYRSFLNRHSWLRPVFTIKNDDKSLLSNTAVSELSSQRINYDHSADLMPPPKSKNVLKKTKLAKPASWANQKFYKYLFDFFKPRYGIEYRKKSEDFVLFLHPYVESVVLLKEKKDYAPLVTAVVEKTKELGLCLSLWDYKYLCDHLPYAFKAKSYYCGTKLYDPVIDYLAPF